MACKYLESCPESDFTSKEECLYNYDDCEVYQRRLEENMQKHAKYVSYSDLINKLNVDWQLGR